MVPLPLALPGPAHLRLEFLDAGAVEAMGRDVRIEPVGEGRYVEDLPDEFAPDVG
jgi:hypothetical protein